MGVFLNVVIWPVVEQNTTSDLRGVYVTSNAFPIGKANEVALEASLKVPGVDGLVLVLGWAAIEPAMSVLVGHAGSVDEHGGFSGEEEHFAQRTASEAACATDAIATWQQAGYRPSLLLKGWDETTGSFKKSFPDKSFSVAIIAGTNPFPPIAENGSVITVRFPM